MVKRKNRIILIPRAKIPEPRFHVFLFLLDNWYSGWWWWFLIHTFAEK